MAKGHLYLVPTGLGGEAQPLLPAATLQVVHRLERFVAENAKSARAFLKGIAYPRPLQHAAIEVLDEHTPQSRVSELVQPLEAGADCGLLAEAGCPAVADPGANLVAQAHASGITVIPLVGPSALLLALMASGLNGQRFAFHGYLPVERTARARRLAELEAISEKEHATQLFIEAPYRNEALFGAIVESCRADTLLCLATDLTLPTEAIRTLAVGAWKKQRVALDRRPTVFLLYRQGRARREKG